MTFQDLARRLGAWCWLERRLFEIVGGWAATSTEPAVKAHFAAAARHHADHAALLEALLPNAYTPPPKVLVAPVPEAPVFDALRDVRGDHERLAGLYRIVVPALLTSYQAYLDEGNPASDGPYLRTVRSIANDERDDSGVGTTLLAALAGGINDVDHLAHIGPALEKSLVNPPFLGTLFVAVLR